MKCTTAIVFSVVAHIFAGCDQSTSETVETPEPPRKTVIETPDGTVTASTTTQENVPQEIVPASSDDMKQFISWAKDAKEFRDAHGPSESENELIQYDEAFTAWQESDKKTYSAETVINLLGAYLGQQAVEQLEMEWVVVTDQYGKDFAVRHKTLEVMGFPFSSVMKRIESKEHDFIHGVFHTLKHRIESEGAREHTSSEQDGGDKASNAANSLRSGQFDSALPHLKRSVREP